MKIPDDDTSRMLEEEECPGSPDLESALANESVGSAARYRGVEQALIEKPEQRMQGEVLARHSLQAEAVGFTQP